MTSSTPATTATTTMEETIGFNNVGVALLEMGNIYEARGLFGLAIEGMKGVIDSKLVERCTIRTTPTHDSVGESHVSCSFSSGVPVVSPPPPPLHHQPPSSQHQQDQQQQSPNTPLHIPFSSSSTHAPHLASFTNSRSNESGSTAGITPLYDFLRPIYISEDEFLLNNAPLIKLTISLLFNLAISDHAIAMSMMTTTTTTEGGGGGGVAIAGDNISISTKTASISTAANAIFLYQLAYCLQIKDGIELSRIHTMGMINNVGRLLAFLGDAKESENCFRHLLKKVMVQSVEESSRVVVDPVDGGGGGDDATMLSKEHHEELGQLEGFLNNIMTVVLRNNLSSPAA